MVKVGNYNLNITPELQETLRQNPPKSVKKAVIERKLDEKGDFIQKKDEEGTLLYKNAEINTHPFVYFDQFGNFYFRAFPSIVIEFEGKKVEVLVTNPAVKTEKDCNLYAAGLVSHRQPIPGSELWDNGRTDLVKHSELICKGDPLKKIVCTLTREEVLAIDLKPQGESLVSKFANATPEEKAVIKQYLNSEE